MTVFTIILGGLRGLFKMSAGSASQYELSVASGCTQRVIEEMRRQHDVVENVFFSSTVLASAFIIVSFVYDSREILFVALAYQIAAFLAVLMRTYTASFELFFFIDKKSANINDEQFLSMLRTILRRAIILEYDCRINEYDPLTLQDICRLIDGKVLCRFSCTCRRYYPKYSMSILSYESIINGLDEDNIRVFSLRGYVELSAFEIFFGGLRRLVVKYNDFPLATPWHSLGLRIRTQILLLIVLLRALGLRVATYVSS